MTTTKKTKKTKVVDGKWWMESGGWKVVDGKWWMESGFGIIGVGFADVRNVNRWTLLFSTWQSR